MQNNVFGLNRRRALIASGAAACATLLPAAAHASHHFEAAAGRNNPKIALTDFYVFKAAEGDRTVFLLDVNFAPKAGEDLLDRGAVYNIHCATSDDLKSGMTWTFAYDGPELTCHQLDEANGALGAKGRKLGAVAEGKPTELPDGIRAWVGRVKDPFFGNSPALGAFRAQLAQGKYDPSVWEKASGKNIFLGRTCGVLVLEIPNKMLGRQISAFTTVAVNQAGQWNQVQYMAKSLMSHVMLFEDEALKTAFDASRPDTQTQFINFFSARIARSAHFAKSRPDPFAYGDETAKRLLPDVVPYTVGSEAAYTAERFNGRKLSDDAMSTTLSLLIGTPIDQHLKDLHNYTDKFPYVIPA